MILNKDFRNSEYYSDPTACIAIANVMRESRGRDENIYAGTENGGFMISGSCLGQKRGQDYENWEDFSNRIILQAVDDYRKAKKEWQKIRRKKAEKTIREIETFFLSDWFMQMTNADGEQILKRLQKEVAE